MLYNRMDIIDDIMRTLDLKGALYFRTHFSDPWAVTVPTYQNAARFHLVVQGHCHVSVNGQSPTLMGPGDIILVPRGSTHVLSHNGAVTAPPLETVLEDAGYDGNGVLILGEGPAKAGTQMVCGHLNFRNFAHHPILDALPDHIHVQLADRSAEPWLDDTLRLISRRMFSGDLGTAATVTRLSEIVFLEILKSNLTDSDELESLFTAFKDPKVSQALAAMHAEPASGWTVQSLAEHVGMSRSRFSDRFSELMGTSPMSYLADWRLQKSLQLLGQNQCTIQEVSSQAGYQSPAAFSRAFSSRFNVSPKVYRDQYAH